MATECGGDVPGRKGVLSTDSVDQVDLHCGVCTKKKKRTEAVKYCVTCEDYYCEKCLDIHDLIPTSSAHVTVGKSDFSGVGKGAKLPPIPTERCGDHPAKIVDMICETHKQVGCATCMATQHSE